jgi:hypothetical protein
MVLTNNTEINPAQTESSKTAARGELSLNIIMVRITLVSARPIADRRILLVIAVHNAAIISIIRIIKFICRLPSKNIVYGQ